MQGIDFFMLLIFIESMPLTILTDCNSLNKESQRTASMCCKSRMNTLPFPKTVENSQQLWKRLRRNQLLVSWFDLKRHTLPSWEWINGTETDGSVIPDHKYGCAYYNVETKTINASSCGSRNFGHICLYKHCQSCLSLHTRPHSCIMTGKDCYIFKCDHKEWYRAALDCHVKGAELAILNRKTINSVIQDRFLCKSFWIGMRRENWISSTGLTLNDVELSLWGPDEPTNNGNCTIFEITQDTFIWRAVPCSSKYNFLCSVDDNLSTVTHAYVAATSDDHFKRHNKSYFPVEGGRKTQYALGIGIPIIVTISVILLCMFCRQPARNRTQKNEEEFPLCIQDEPDHRESALQIIGYDKDEDLLIPLWHNLQDILFRPDTNDPSVPLAIVSISGPFRLGKSFLMNYMLRYLRALEIGKENTWLDEREAELTGFNWYHGVEVATLGIWLWGRPFKIRLSETKTVSFLLMDTQGLFDNNHNSEAATMVTIASMLSSIQIYNISGQLEQSDLDHFKLFRETGRYVSEGSKRFPFPLLKRLIFLIRDRGLDDEFQIGAEGGSKYFEELFQGTHPNREYIQAKCVIEESVGQVDCYLMPDPGERATVKIEGDNEYKGEISGLDEQFVKSLDAFAKFLFHLDKVYETDITGIIVFRKIMWCVSQFNSHKIARPESTIEDLIDLTNKKTLSKALQHCSSTFSQVLDNDEGSSLEQMVYDLKKITKKVEDMYTPMFIGEDRTTENMKQTLRTRLENCIPEGLKFGKGSVQLVNQACDSYRKNMRQVLVEERVRSLDRLMQFHNRERKRARSLMGQERKNEYAAFKKIISAELEFYKTVI